jgi:hypothetical protein
MYVRTQRGLGQQFSDIDPSLTTQPLSLWDDWFADWWPTQSSSLASGTAQIQSVPANAAAANAAAVAAGQPAPYNVAAIQAVADQQSGQFAAENAQIWNTANNASWPWYYWVAIAAGAIWVYGELK